MCGGSAEVLDTSGGVTSAVRFVPFRVLKKCVSAGHFPDNLWTSALIAAPAW